MGVFLAIKSAFIARALKLRDESLNSDAKPKPWKEVSSVYFTLFPNDPLRGAVFPEEENKTFAHKIMKRDELY